MIHHREEEIALSLHRADLAEQLLRLAVEPRVLDGHGGLRREQHGDRLVFVVELGGVDLLGQVEIPEHHASAFHRNAEERFHLRMMRREPEPLRVAVQIGSANRLRFTDYMAEQTAAARRVSNATPRLVVDARRHKLHHRLAVLTEDAKGGVLRPHDFAGRVHHRLQHVIEIVPREDRDTGR